MLRINKVEGWQLDSLHFFIPPKQLELNRKICKTVIYNEKP